VPPIAAFDRAAAKTMTKAADIEPDNLRVASAEIVLRDKARKDATELERIPAGRVVPLVTLGQESLTAGWNAIAMPDGRLGYADKPALNDLAVPSICFSKTKKGDWAIAATIQRKDGAP
jgi:hypothetical protein